MIKIVIFDLDGTLFDTTCAMQTTGNFALEKLGLSLLSRRDYALISGGDVEGYVNGVLDKAGDPEHRHFDAFWRYHLARTATLGDEANVPYPGIVELLSALREKGVTLAVLSNKDHETCVEVVEKYFGKEAFHKIYGNRPGIAPKPDPAGIFAILEETGTRPQECLYVGDTQFDVECAKRAGVKCAAVLWGYRTREILEEMVPEFLVEKPLDILTLI